MSRLELFFEDRERRQKFWFLLQPIAQIYRLAIILRHFFYRFLPSHKGEIPVACIGSVFVGGSGKTPFVRLLLEYLPDTTWVLTRGYRALDEPLFYPRCVISKDRILGVKRCIEAGAKLVLMDDGLQHLALKKDIKIALLTKEQIEKEWAFLPFGSLRDLPKTLEEVDYIVLHEVESMQEYEELQKKVPQKKFIGTKTVFKGFFNDKGEKIEVQEAILLSSIARPKRFRSLVEKEGVRVLEHVILPDHGTIAIEKLEELKAKAVVLMTEKDFVKYPLEKNLIQAKIESTVVYNTENFEDLLGKLCCKSS